MKINIKRAGITAGIFFTVIYAACLLAIILIPNIALWYFGLMTHAIDYSTILVPTITLANAIIGLVVMFISGYLAGILFAWLWNKLGK